MHFIKDLSSELLFKKELHQCNDQVHAWISVNRPWRDEHQVEALALRPPLLHVHQQAQVLYTVYSLSTEELSSISLPRWRVPWYSRRVLPLFWIIKYQYLSMQRSKNFHSPLETSTERIELNCVQYLLSCMYIYIANVSLCTTYNVSIHVFDTLLHVFLVNICTWVIFFIHIYRS